MLSMMKARRDNDELFKGLPEMTLLELKRCALEHGGYETPELNDILYLHYKGYKKIENLNQYLGLKTLYLDSNGFEKIENVDHLSYLRCLFLNKNLISTIENLSGLNNLVQLDLSDNRISHVQGLSILPNLATLNLSRNYLSDGFSISHLKECSQQLTTVNLSFNHLRGEDVMLQLLAITSIVVLEMKENPVVRELSHFRKKCIVGMPKLRSLDTAIFDEERLCAEAWAVGGREAEVKAKRDWQVQQNENNRQNLAKFREWKNNIRNMKEQERQQESLFGPTQQKQAELKHADQLREARMQKAAEDAAREKDVFRINDDDDDGYIMTEEYDMKNGSEAQNLNANSSPLLNTEIEEFVDQNIVSLSESGFDSSHIRNKKKNKLEEEEEDDDILLELKEQQQANTTLSGSQLVNNTSCILGQKRVETETAAEKHNSTSVSLDDNEVCLETKDTRKSFSSSSDNTEPTFGCNRDVALDCSDKDIVLREQYVGMKSDACSLDGDREHGSETTMQRLIQDSLALCRAEKLNGRAVNNSMYAAKSTWGDDSSEEEPFILDSDLGVPSIDGSDDQPVVETTFYNNNNSQVSKSCWVESSVVDTPPCLSCLEAYPLVGTSSNTMEGDTKDVGQTTSCAAPIVHKVYTDSNGRQLSWEGLEALPTTHQLSIFSNKIPQAVVSIDDHDNEHDEEGDDAVVSTADLRSRLQTRLLALDY